MVEEKQSPSVSETDTKQGSKNGTVRYILFASMALIIIAGIFIFAG